jgi:hypothetical protein
MNRQIPLFISRGYRDGARGFKAEKRAQVRELSKVFRDGIMMCSSYLPNEGIQVGIIYEQIISLRKELSAKNWGR